MADKEKRQRWFSIQRNYDFETHDKDNNRTWDITPQQWKDEIIAYFKEQTSSGAFLKVAMVFHDKDVVDTGFKPLHVHAIVYMKNPIAIGKVEMQADGTLKRTGASKALGASSSKNISALQDDGQVGAMAKYNLHITEKAIRAGKHIYDEDNVVLMGDIHDYHELLVLATSGSHLKDADADGILLRKKIHDGEMTMEGAYKWIFEKYGADDPVVAQLTFDKNRPYYEKAVEDYYNAYAKEQKRHRNLTNVFVGGTGGSGKSTMSKELGALLDPLYAPYVAPQPRADVVYDIADGYDYEKVSILDDVEPSNFAPLEFTGIFDPGTYRMTASRQRNKHFLPNTNFISIERNIEDYISDMMLETKNGNKYGVKFNSQMWERHQRLNSLKSTRDMYHQVERRIKFVIYINGNEADDNMTINVFEFIAKSKDAKERYKLIAKQIPWKNYTRNDDNVIVDDDKKVVHEAALQQVYKLLFETSDRPDLGHYETIFRDMDLVHDEYGYRKEHEKSAKDYYLKLKNAGAKPEIEDKNKIKPEDFPSGYNPFSKNGNG